MENTTIISPSKSTNFTKYDFFWKESESDEVAQAVEVLNTLTPEQVKAVKKLIFSSNQECLWCEESSF